MRHQVVLCMVFLFLVACAPPAEPAPDVHAVQTAIEGVNAQFMEAFNKGDAAGAAAFYTEDAIAMPPGQTMAKGRQAIQEGMASDFAAVSMSQLKLTTSDVAVTGDTAVEVGTYSIQVGDKPDNGKYLVVWKRQADGSWKLHRDIWNSSVMSEAAPEPAADAQAQ